MKYIIFFILCLSFKVTLAQVLGKDSILDFEKDAGVVYKYSNQSEGHWGYISLILYQDSSFKYRLETSLMKTFSNGKWFRYKDEVVLNSNIEFDNLPVELVYVSDSNMDRRKNSEIGIVENEKGELFTDALVYINTDTIQYLPLMGTCIGDYKTIDSVKIVFENGLSSKWIKVNKGNFRGIIPVVQSDLNLSQYEAFKDRRYRITRNGLILIGL